MKRVFGTLLVCGFLAVTVASAKPVASHPSSNHRVSHKKPRKNKKHGKGHKAVARKAAPKKVDG